MKVVVNRILNNKSTISTVEVDNMIKYYGMEPENPIPAGTYTLIPYNSPIHGKIAMLGGSMAKRFIEVHIGNYPKDTRNCLLLGAGYMDGDFISSSKIAVDEFTSNFYKAYHTGEKCTITFKDLWQK